MKITDIKDFPSKLLKNKKITFYKAFFMKPLKDGVVDEMKIRTDVDLLAVSEEDAVADLIRNTNISDLMKDAFSSLENDENSFNGQIVSIATFTMDTETLKSMDLLDEGDPNFHNGLLTITLNGKPFDIDVYDKRLVSYKMNIDENEIKIITGLVLEDV